MAIHTKLERSPIAKPDNAPPEADYDLNFCLQVPDVLESDRVKLVPFVPFSHKEQYIQGVEDHPELFKYLPYGPFTTLDQADIFFEHTIRANPAVILFAIIDRTRVDAARPDQGGTFAGVIGFLNTLPEHLSTEIGHVIILPAWQRSFLATNAIGLVLAHALALPDTPAETKLANASKGGWGLRRVQWQAHEENEASVRCAKRLGFRLEGIIRWQRILTDKEKVGLVSRPGDRLLDYRSRHSAMLSVCWDDWEQGGKELVEGLMARK